MSTLPRAPVPSLHLIDGDGAIASPRTVAAYLTKVIGAEESKIPALTSNARGAPSIAALRERGCNYRVVGVFGGQSTGKSTLLNLLFGTRFDVMNADEGRTQTTKGCFLGKALVDTSASGGGELFVMDFEGTDGAERGENQSFEKQLSLFALSVADTLIVNMFVQEVGRFNAANLSLLQTVFEVNLQLLSHESARPTAETKPTLLFVLRDHVDGPVQKLREGIVKSLDGIWSRIGKPESFAQTTFNDFFNLSFCALPHYKLQRPQFDDAVDDLRRWFSDPRCPSFLYAGVGPDNYRHIPLDDVADYLANCWHSIQTVKDLDIPTQREMLALVRCQEVSEALAAEHEADMKKRLARLKEGVFIPNITGWIRAVIRQRLAAFAAETGHYAKTVTKNATSELQRRLELTSEPLLDAQCKRLCDALVRASGDRVQAVMDLAFNSVLPRLATEWYSKIENARSAAASAAKNDDEVTRNTKIAEAQRRVKVSASVKKFWDFVAAELQSVQDLLQTQINSTASGSSTGGTTSGRGTPVDAESRSATPIDARDEPSAALTKLLQCLRGDSDAVQRTLDLVQLTLHKQVVERLQFVSSDLSSSMTKVFDQHLAKNSDGTVRFLTTAKGLQKAFGPARAAGLLLAACCAVYRLNDASHDESLQDPAIATLVDRWSADAMHLDFAIDENTVNLIGAPVYPTLPTPPALNKLRVVSRDEDDDSATAQTTQDTTSTTGAAALRLFATRIVVDESRLSRAVELYQQQCSFTYTMQMKQIEAGTSNTPVWMWALVLLLGANEIWWLLTNPLMLIFLAAAVWFFFRNWVEAQWHKFEETGPAQLVIPAQAAVSYMGHAYATHVAPRLGGAAAAPRKTKAE